MISMIRKQYRKLTKWERFLQRFYHALSLRLSLVGAWAAFIFLIAAEWYWLRLQGWQP